MSRKTLQQLLYIFR